MSHRLLSPLAVLVVGAAAVQGQGFVERATELGIVHECATGFDRLADLNIFDFTQRGMAAGDVDGDGDPDLVCMGGILPNTVLLNAGGTFVDASAAAGIEVGEFDSAPALGDFDGDGDLDLVIAANTFGGFGGPGEPGGRFYRNRGDGTFEETTTLAGTVGKGHTLLSVLADMDRDGLLDVVQAEFFTTKNGFYRNNGDGTFTEVGAAVGLDLGGSSHTTCVLDADGDRLLDVMVGNDYIVSKPHLPNNVGDRAAYGQEDGTWLDLSAGSGFEHERGIMGFAIGDVNYDGLFDVYKTDVDQNRLVINHGWPAGGAWTEEQLAYGVPAHPVNDDAPPMNKGVGWGCVFMDFDFDLWLDLFTVNGQVAAQSTTNPWSPRNQRNFLYTGDGPGAGFTFSDSTEALGLLDEVDDRCLVVLDAEQDGDVDVVVSPTVGFLRYYENRIDPAGRGWLMVKPVTRTSAPGGFGVEVEFTDSLGYPHRRVIGLDGSTASQHERFAYFGLGDEPEVDLTVRFPSGVELVLPGVQPNQVLTPEEPELVRVAARTVPIDPAVPSGTRRAPAEVGPDGLWAVDAFAHDQAGTPLDGTADVTIEAPGLAPETDVLHLGGNHFRRYFRVPSTPGEHRATVTFDGWEVAIRPRVLFYDRADASGTTAAVIPEAVRAGSADVFDVVVAPKDANGVSLGPGDQVDVKVAGVTALVGPIDHGDGRYRFTFPAPATAGEHAISVIRNGSPVPLGLVVEAGGAVSAEQSQMKQEVGNEANSAAPHQMRLLLTPRDADGLRLGPYVDVELVPVAGGGTPPVLVRPEVGADGQRDGQFPFLVEKPAGKPVSGHFEVWVDGVESFQIGYGW